MTKTHWKKLYNPEFLGAYSLDNGAGGYIDIVATIKSITQQEIVGDNGKKDICSVMHFAEENIKPMVLNATNNKMIAGILKSNYVEDWAGRKIQIGVEKVKVGREYTDALRVRSFLPRESGRAKCADCDMEVSATDKMTALQIAAYAKAKYAKVLCADCMTKLAQKPAAPAPVGEDEAKHAE